VFFLGLKGVGEVTRRVLKALVMSSRGEGEDVVVAEDGGVGSDSAGRGTVPMAAACCGSGNDGHVSEDVGMPIAVLGADTLDD